jgi:hypothetical protein
MNAILEQLKSWQGITSAIGTIIPGFSFFLNFAPPLFNEISLITSAIAVLTFVLVSRSNKIITQRRIIIEITVSFIILMGYLILFKYTTVQDEEAGRHQIGFYTSPFSLTTSAQTMVSNGFCSGETPSVLLSCVEGELEDRISLIWGFWVIVAGLLLIAMFVASSLLWVRSFCYLAKFQKE